MKKLIFLTFILLLTQSVIAQQTSESLKKELASVNVGFLGAWITYERQLGKQFTVNAQLGVDGGFFRGNQDFSYIFVPTLSVEPRFYYNFNKRVKKGKRTFNNSANYFALTTTIIPNLFEITNDKEGSNGEIETGVQLIPKWGLRRTIGKSFKFDFAIGYGIAFRGNRADDQIGLDLKIGYVFFNR